MTLFKSFEFFGNSHLTDNINRQTNQCSLKCTLCECTSKSTLQIVHQIEVYDLKFFLMYNETTLQINLSKLHCGVQFANYIQMYIFTKNTLE